MAMRGHVSVWHLDAYEVDLDAAISTKFTWTLPHPILIHRVGFIYTEATPGTIATPGQVALAIDGTNVATYTAETSKALGFTGFLTSAGQRSLNLFLSKGKKLEFKHTVQQTSTVAGRGIFLVYFETIPDGEV